MKHLFIFLLSFILFANIARSQNQDKSATVQTTPRPFELGITDEIQSAQLSEKRILNIYLPEGYHADIKTSYPVIYLLDGSANEDFVHIAGLVQFCTMIQAMPKSIVVGIANIDRRRDFTFPTSIQEDIKDFPTAGASEKFMAFIEKDLQPYMEKKYRTNASKTIIGQSLGGLFATEVLLKKPSLFNNYIIISPSLWWNNQSLLAAAPQLLKSLADQTIKAYVSVGTEGKIMENDAKKLAEILKGSADKNLQVTFNPMPAENHLTILHNSAYKAFEILNAKK
ncbi:esterase [Pedobacter lusitanus]|uniref:Esterase n=1 Tax=Pedobacter lusitanus TaxID=1503925 RepID=A0A0D0GVL9_9SPHI|nr:alpha/beta hydrolase-fold protein [Pedobacter lusitanus]KIO78471.1 esterase [Pedobacter lusitanus]